MPLNASRLRWWFAASAIALAVVIAGVYFYGRARVRRALTDVPQKLGVNIEQSTQGFTFSKSQGGHTLFTVHASKLVQYKETGKAELRDVNIIVFGRDADRYDQIYGADFEYDPKAGLVTAKGEVHIDLQGNSEGPVNPDLALPRELKNPIHLKTSGLVFNNNTGVAETKEKIEFRIPQASGFAVGATYDSKAATFTMHSDIEVVAAEPNPATIHARRGVISKGPDRAVLEDLQVHRPDGNFTANQLTIYFRDDNTVEHVVASGNVRARASGKTSMDLQAPRADVYLTAKNDVRSALVSGGVAVDASGDQNLQATAGRVQLAFAAGNHVSKVTALDGVKLLQQSSKTSPTMHPVEITALAVDFLIKNGKSLAQAVTQGTSQIAILPLTGATSQDAATTVASAGKFEASFGNRNRLQRVIGTPDAKVVSSTPGQPEKVATSDRLEVTFNPAGGIAALTQEGHFHYAEPGMAGGGERAAWAEHASFTPADQVFVLAGSPRIVEGGLTTTADSLRLDRRTGDALATGSVKSTYSELKPQPGGAFLATTDPIHVTARSMTAQRSSGVARYLEARLWQDANVVEAPVLDFHREPRRLEARGDASHRVTTVFVQKDKSGKLTPVNVTSAKLTYTDAQRQARFEGGVVVRGADMSMTADQVDVFLQSGGQASSTARGTPSQIDRIVAAGHVVLHQPNRRATGQSLVFSAAEGKFVLTGGPPSIFDAERGKITGDSLTFYNRDDRVLVESSTSSPTVTQTRVAK